MASAAPILTFQDYHAIELFGTAVAFLVSGLLTGKKLWGQKVSAEAERRKGEEDKLLALKEELIASYEAKIKVLEDRISQQEIQVQQLHLKHQAELLEVKQLNAKYRRIILALEGLCKKHGIDLHLSLADLIEFAQLDPALHPIFGDGSPTSRGGAP